MKRRFILFIPMLLLGSFQVKAQNTADPKYQLVQGKKYGFYKNTYVLTLFQALPDVKKLLETDADLTKLLQEKKDKVTMSSKAKGFYASDYAKLLKFEDQEIALVSKTLGKLHDSGNALGSLVKDHLIPSGCYTLFSTLSPKEMLIKAWEQDAKATNYAIDVYLAGAKPNYPKIDSISFAPKDRGFAELAFTGAGLVFDDTRLFFEPTLRFAMMGLELNNRNEAYDFEPLLTGENKAAVAAIRKTKWDKYKYSVILVPGAGPEERETELSADGMIRCRLGAAEFKKGLAPFVVVSGGRVHPYKTKYSEAIEMKKYMIATLGIPESAIIIEPQARHTTTNLRNCIRLMFRYGIDMEKPGLVATTRSGSMYIGSLLLDRCVKELGYEPYKNGKRLSETTVEFYPDSASLQLDWDEPLDP